MLAVDGDMAETLLEAAREGVADGDGVVGVVDGFGGARFDGQEPGADFERQFLNGGIVGREELQEFRNGLADSLRDSFCG